MLNTLNGVAVRLLVAIKDLGSRARSESGQDLIEYALLGGLVAIALTGAALVFSGAISALGQGISDCVDFKSSSPCDPF